MGRVEEIWDSAANTALEYSYLGLRSIVIEELSDVSFQLDYYTSGTYGGFDRFDRVVEHDWSVGDNFSYGYDLASNRTYREHVGPSTKDELYGYDGVRRLVEFDRGDLDGEKDGMSGTIAREDDFSLDPTGNWTDYVQKTSGSTDLNQDRTHNEVDETTNITETTGTAWITPAHDAAGNMTTMPKPSSLANGYTCTYDAWNRLVEVEDGGTVVGKYEYDGLNRRIKKHRDSQSPASPNGVDKYEHYFYNADWQLLETRDSSVETTEPEELEPKYQYVYSLRYIDAVAVRYKNTDADGLCDDESLYYIADANFNVTCLLDDQGTVVERYNYDPYGNTRIYDVNWSTRSTSSYDNTLRYTGREYDPESGVYHYRMRYYHGQMGRFVSRDPIGYEGGDANLYGYVGSGPANRTDPSGQDWWCLWLDDLFGTPSMGDRIGGGIEAFNNFDSTLAGAQTQQELLVKELADPNSTMTGEQAAAVQLGILGNGLSEAGAIADGGLATVELVVTTASAATVAAGGMRAGANRLIRPKPGGAKPGWPGSSPAQSPPGTTWRGKPGSRPGSSQGNYYNRGTGESFHPDLTHPKPIGPHWDYRAPDGTWYRIMPDGTMVPK